jgi:phenylalanyl-tRNA synthetase alpha chain
MSDELQEAILTIVSKQAGDTPINSLSIADQLKRDHQSVIGCMNSLLTHDDIIRCDVVASKKLDLTSEGVQFVDSGSHEAQVFAAVPKGTGITQSDLMAAITDPKVDKKVGFSKAIAQQWISMDKSSKLVNRKAEFSGCLTSACDLMTCNKILFTTDCFFYSQWQSQSLC